MANDNEVKDPQDLIGETLDALTGAKDVAQENSPENVQPEVKTENVDNTVKTGESVTAEGAGVPENVPYKRFQEINQRHKEATELLKQRDSEREQYSKLLDDPQVYAKWLKQQGYSDAHINQALAEKGFQTPQNKLDAEKSSEAMAVAEMVCAKLGWDITRLTPEQKAYVQDSVSLNMAVIEDRVSSILDKRLGPIEQMSNEMSQQKQFNSEESEVLKLASTEFPDVSWEEVIKPAISKFLGELDEKDPKRTIQLSYEDIYYRATRPLLRELELSKGRQEVRDKNKANARPLGTGTATKSGEPVSKGANPRDQLEAILDAKGIR